LLAFAIFPQQLEPALQHSDPSLQHSDFAMSPPQHDVPALQQLAPSLQHEAASFPLQQAAPSLQQAAPSLQHAAAAGALPWPSAVGAAFCAHILMANNTVTIKVLIFISDSSNRLVSFPRRFIGTVD
jgi:hypothetical protein